MKEAQIALSLDRSELTWESALMTSSIPRSAIVIGLFVGVLASAARADEPRKQCCTHIGPGSATGCTSVDILTKCPDLSAEFTCPAGGMVCTDGVCVCD